MRGNKLLINICSNFGLGDFGWTKAHAGNTGFASCGVACLVNIDERALFFYSSSVQVSPERARCSESRPNAKPVNVSSHFMTTLHK